MAELSPRCSSLLSTCVLTTCVPEHHSGAHLDGKTTIIIINHVLEKTLKVYNKQVMGQRVFILQEKPLNSSSGVNRRGCNSGKEGIKSSLLHQLMVPWHRYLDACIKQRRASHGVQQPALRSDVGEACTLPWYT